MEANNIHPPVKKRRRSRRKKCRISDLIHEKKVYTTIESLEDLIDYTYTLDDNNRKTVAMRKLLPVLEELNGMVGMKDLKNSIADMCMYYIKELHIHATMDGHFERSKNDSLHTVITGKPGCGKTEVATIIAKIYANLGVLNSEEVVYAKVTDFIGQYVGQTEHNTLKTLESAKGKVLFCDEAYSLGDTNKSITSYSKAAINMINDWIEKHKHDFAFIIAGYKDKLNTNFFGSNPGLKRRFRWIYNIEEYTDNELLEIFFKAVYKEFWYIDDHAITTDFFKENKEMFPYTGGDINIFLDKCKKAHTKRIFCMKNPEVKVLTKKDIEEGLKLYKAYKLSLKTSDEGLDLAPQSMYM